VGVVKPPTHHLCQDCALAEEPAKGPPHEEKAKQKNSKIIFLDRFR